MSGRTAIRALDEVRASKRSTRTRVARVPDCSSSRSSLQRMAVRDGEFVELRAIARGNLNYCQSLLDATRICDKLQFICKQQPISRRAKAICLCLKVREPASCNRASSRWCGVCAQPLAV